MPNGARHGAADIHPENTSASEKWYIEISHSNIIFVDDQWSVVAFIGLSGHISTKFAQISGRGENCVGVLEMLTFCTLGAKKCRLYGNKNCIQFVVDKNKFLVFIWPECQSKSDLRLVLNFNLHFQCYNLGWIFAFAEKENASQKPTVMLQQSPQLYQSLLGNLQ